MDALAARALFILSIAILLGGASAWAFLIYVFIVSPRWLKAFEGRTKAIENFAAATQDELRSHGRVLDDARIGMAEGEARLHQKISDVGDRVITAIHSESFGRVERAVESIRSPKARGSGGG